MKFFCLLILMVTSAIQRFLSLPLLAVFMNVSFHDPSLPPLAAFCCDDQFGSSPIDGAWSTKGIFLSAAAL